MIGDAEKFLMKRKDALVSSLATLLVRKKVETVDELLGLSQVNGNNMITLSINLLAILSLDFS